MGMTQSGKAHIGFKRYGCCEGRACRAGLRIPHRLTSLLALMFLMLSACHYPCRRMPRL